MTVMKMLTGASVALTCAGAALAQESGAKSINTGSEKGAYHALFCPPLPAALSNAYFQGYKCTSSKGTLENIDRVLRHPTSIGFAQLDIYANEASKRPEEFKTLTVIRSDIACEGLWMVTKNPDLKNYGFRIFETRYLCVLDYRGFSIGSSVSADNVRRAAQIGRSANQINCCDPNSPDFGAANT